MRERRQRHGDENKKPGHRKVRQSGLRQQEYLLHAALETPIHVVEDLKPLLGELRAWGRNLNQLTVLAHQGHIESANLQEATEMKKQTAGAMGGVLRYVAQEQKTVDTDGTRYLTGINCAADLAYQSFLATKNLYGKARGTWFYHYVQSFPPQERVTPAEAHQIAQELAERFFPDCEVLVATHIDRAHLHSHLVVNSVKPDTGEKLHFTPRTLEQMRLVSDQICREHGLTTLKPYRPKKQVKGLRPGEYRSAMRGQSWKFQLIAVIEAVMERTGNREEFLNELRRRGYDARWEEGRKRITYITPTGGRKAGNASPTSPLWCVADRRRHT